MFIPLSKPDLSALEKQYVLEVLDSGQLSFGPKLKQFEQKCAQIAGRAYAAAVNSGTSALHLAVKVLGLQKGDEVITTPYSFIASSNCLLYEGIKPVFVDIEPDTYNIDPLQIEKAITPKTKAILVVHVFGQPANMEAIMSIAQKHRLYVIEDACEAIGAEWNGKRAGSFGDISVFAFYPNKQITTGEGGIFLTDHKQWHEAACSYRNQGRNPNNSWLEHERVGYNYRMSDLQAAVGLAQIERIDEILTKRETVAQRYIRFIQEEAVPVTLQSISHKCKMSWFVFVVLLPSDVERQLVMNDLSNAGIQTRPYFPSIHLQSVYRHLFTFKEGDFPITEMISNRSIALPFYNELDEQKQRYVVKKLKEAIERSRQK